MSFLENTQNRVQYLAIIKKWNDMCDAHVASQSDEVIEQDNEFAKEIIDFLLDSIVITNAKPDIIAQGLSEFCAFFHYGPIGPDADEYNYLDFDEISVYNILQIKDPEKATVKQIETINKKLELARKRFD